MITGKFIVPDYYPEFLCKGSKCRSCCCDGWTITVNQDEYFRLRDLDLSKDRKEKVDAYIGILPHPTSDRYARINLNFFGECPRRLENGYCGLQVEVGEEHIPSVCRYYPRAPRLYPYPVSCLLNSCEWVLEKRREDNRPLSFKERQLTFYFNDDEGKKEFPSDYLSLHTACIKKREDRFLPFQERILSLASVLNLDVSFFSKEREDFVLLSLKEKFKKSFSIQDYLPLIPSVIPSRKEREDKRRKLFPDFDIYREKFFVNHLVFTLFPYVDSIEDKRVSYLGLFFVYDFYLLLRSSNLKDGEKNSFVDLSSHYFRVVEHSNFYRLVSSLINGKKRDKE